MKNEQKTNENQFNRRDFLKGGSLATVMMMMGGVPLQAQITPRPEEDEAAGPGLKVGVIGCGIWGREIISTLARLGNVEAAAVCDNYAPFLRRARGLAPEAEGYEDYEQLLNNKEIQAVVVATPSHLHRDIVLAAIQAGKHVYCEAPVAHTIEDARIICQAAQKTPRIHFQAGQQLRSDPQIHYVLSFVRAGTLGNTVSARAHWHKKQSWVRPAPTAAREREMNWRLRNGSSPGLIGEIGLHQVDLASWFLNARPEAVTGFGSLMHWRDGRDVPDTIQATYEFPTGALFSYDATLCNSFEGEADKFFGTDSAIMFNERRAWMFKEVDSPLLGWEVYARKETFGKETGIVLAADATKLEVQGDNPVLDAMPDDETSLFYALEAFIANSNSIQAAVEDFIDSFGDDEEMLADYLGDIRTKALPYAGPREAYDAAVIALTSNEAILKKKRILFASEWFELG
jgi:predicted dehydrogenase